MALAGSVASFGLILDEESSTMVVNELLTLKKGPDPALLELEDRARDALLEKVSSSTSGQNSF